MSHKLPSYLSQPPQINDFPAPPVTSKPQTLPFLELGWEHFERLCMRIAERVDGAVDFGLYGMQGERQDGIDVYGSRKDGYTSVYQSRRVRSLSASQVRKAVTDFAKGRRPFDPQRFVLCTAISIRSTKVLDALHDCRNMYPDLEIERFDRERLSGFLRTQPDLVESFFGPAWSSLFCSDVYSYEPTTDTRASSNISADMLLRGPIKALGLEHDEARADALEDRREAASVLGRIAVRLGKAGFGFHESLIRERQANALTDAGAIEEAYTIWLDESVADMDSGAHFLAPSCMRKLRDNRGNVPEYLGARYEVLAGMDRWFEDADGGVLEIKNAMERLEAVDDEWAPMAVLWHGEALLVDKPIGASDSEEILQPIRNTSLSGYQSIGVRLRLLLAELTDGWDDLMREASSGRLSPADAGLVFARRGHRFALDGLPEQAIDEYRRAVEKLAHANLLGDASSALLAITNIHFQYGLDYGEAFESHRLARTVANENKRLGGARDARSAALEAYHNQKFPDAHRNLRRYLWEATISGDFTSELEARRLLGDLYSHVKEPAEAVRHYILAGETKKVLELVRQLGQPLDLSDYLDSASPWMIQTTLAIITVQGDLVPDADAEQFLPRLIELAHGSRWPGIARPTIMKAWEAVASIVLQLSENAVNRILSTIAPLIERDPSRGRPMDDSLIDILLRLYRFRPALRLQVGAYVVRLLEQGNLALPLSTWDQLRSFAFDVVRTDRYLQNALAHIASGGSPLVLEMLAYSEVRDTSVLVEAEKRMKYILDMDIDPRRTSWSLLSGIDMATVFVRLLEPAQHEQVARHLAAIARQRKYPEEYRVSALRGIAYLSGGLDPQLRDELFETVLQLTDPDLPVSEIDEFSRSSLHLLSRFRIDLGGGMLSLVATNCAAHLASTQEHASRVMKLVDATLYANGDQTLAAGCSTILALDDTLRPALEVDQLAVHYSRYVRQMAITLWRDDPSSSPDIGRILVHDTERSVRLSLAWSLDILQNRASTQRDELRTILMVDPSALVRTLARLY